MKIHLRTLVLIFFASFLSIRADEPERIIRADLQQVKRPRSTIWQHCVGAGRVAEGLRAGWQNQLEECHKELGFQYLRMHGLLQDELGVYSEDPGSKPHYNWQYIDNVYDFLASIGMKPFVEFGFMPKVLASGPAMRFWWREYNATQGLFEMGRPNHSTGKPLDEPLRG